MVLKNITRLQQQQEQCKNDSSSHYQVCKNGISTSGVDLKPLTLKHFTFTLIFCYRKL